MGLSIGAKLCRVQVANAVLFLLVLLVSVAAVWSSDRAVALHDVETQRLRVLQKVDDLLSETRLAESAHIFRADATARAQLARRAGALNSELRVLRSITVGTHLAAEAAAIDSAWRIYQGQHDDLTRLARTGRSGEAARMFAGPMKVAYARIDARIDRLIDKIVRDGAAARSRAHERSAVLTVAVILMTSSGVVIALLILLFVRRRIVDRLRDITKSLTRLADGDLEVPVNGGERRDEIGAMVRALEVFRSHARELDEAHRETQRAQAAAEAMARHDPLTGLPNRRLCTEALERAIHNGGPCAVLLLDLDHFKPVNDVHGHDAGDVVLCSIADRFTAHRGELGTIARLGGDEFVVVLPVHGGTEDAARAARLINALVRKPIPVDGGVAEVSATIGISLFPQDGTDPSSLLRAADLAMYQAKTDGRDTYRFFKPAMNDRVQERAMLDTDLRRAIMVGEIRPHYQPLVSIDDGELVGFEILSRWHHPRHGMVMPTLFIPAADERGLLGELTYRVLRQACMDAQDWPEHVRLSLNLSPSQLKDPKLVSRLIAILAQTGVATNRLEIEVTENALITDIETSRAVLAKLQSLGMSIALDDFGTGYSSLNQLRDLKFDKIKIDKSFVHELEHGPDNAAIVRAMIGLSKSLGLTTTAEGVEDPQQWETLSSLGCDFGQGYLFGKAMTADQADDLVHSPPLAQKLGPRPTKRRPPSEPRLAHA